MSDAAAAATAGAAPRPGKKKLFVIVGIVLLVLALVGVGAVVLLKKSGGDHAEGEGDESAEVQKPKKAHKKAEPGALPVYVPLDNFVVNLADRDADRFAQIGLTLEVADAKAAEEIKAYIPAIRNNILLLLGRRSSEELLQAEGKERLARQLLREAVRPMGFDLEDEDEPETAVEEGGKKRKKRRSYDDPDDAPIKSVQFSSFIIQ